MCYPPTDRFKYDQELRSIKQEDYPMIKQYASAIHDAFTKYCLCSNLKPQEQGRQEEDHFYRGLHPATKTELAKQGYDGQEATIRMITTIEESILRDHMDTKPSITFTKENTQRKEVDRKVKYCKNHGNCFHDTS